eukprot:464129-Pyramimonas_sp.AAC.1
MMPQSLVTCNGIALLRPRPLVKYYRLALPRPIPGNIQHIRAPEATTPSKRTAESRSRGHNPLVKHDRIAPPRLQSLIQCNRCAPPKPQSLVKCNKNRTPRRPQ